MAHGLPVIGFSDCTGLASLIMPGVNGIVVKPEHDKIKSLTAALISLMKNPELRGSLANDSGLPKAFELEHVLNQWEQTLCSVIADKRAGKRAYTKSLRG